MSSYCIFLKKTLLLFLLTTLPFFIFAQRQISGEVRDAESGEPLAFANIHLPGSDRGTISNAAGRFQLEIDGWGDSLNISFLGYESLSLEARHLKNDPVVSLRPAGYLLEAFTVRAKDEFLYDLLQNCRKKLKKQEPTEARMYFQLETETQQQPLELIECYYNGTLTGSRIQSLKLKNGRVALADDDGGYFVSVGSSQALTKLDLVNKNELFPLAPLQVSKRGIKKHFRLYRLSDFSQGKHYKIGFESRERAGKYWSGKLWIDKESGTLLRILLQVDHATRFPFQALFPEDKLKDVSMEIEQSFFKSEGTLRLDHLQFQYSFSYENNQRNKEDKGYSAKGLLHAFDYKELFTLPFYSYNPNHNDYRKISFLPYDSLFWEKYPFPLTGNQQDKLSYFEENGFILNFQSQTNDFDENPRRGFFEYDPHFWAADQRIKLTTAKPEPKIDSYFPEEPEAEYLFETQIFLDVTPIGDSLHYNSATIFDLYGSHSYLEDTPQTRCFTNIFFDLCEIERRKLMKVLPRQASQLHEVSELHRQAEERMREVTRRYLREVQQGHRRHQLGKWNKRVKEELGIDNIDLFGLYKEK